MAQPIKGKGKKMSHGNDGNDVMTTMVMEILIVKIIRVEIGQSAVGFLRLV